MRFVRICLLIGCSIWLSMLCSCDSAQNVLEVTIDPPKRKPIDVSRTGVNSFFVNPGFGSIVNQYSDIQNNLRLRYVRVLFAWTDAVQPSPSVEPNFGLYDEIVANAPAGVRLLVVVSHSPSWLSNPANWDNKNPRVTWVNRWLQKVVQRYKGNGKIEGYEVFNEPDVVTLASDTVLQLTDPANYYEMLSYAAPSVRSIDPGKIVVSAATQSINQQFPARLNYNKSLYSLGAAELVDVWAIHFYSEQYERVVQKNGVEEFLKTVPRPIWVTESGNEGVNNQLAYVEKVWPFLLEHIPNIDRFYYYEYSSQGAPETAFGLRTTSSQFPVSDLYVYLANR